MSRLIKCLFAKNVGFQFLCCVLMASKNWRCHVCTTLLGRAEWCLNYNAWENLRQLQPLRHPRASNGETQDKTLPDAAFRRDLRSNCIEGWGLCCWLKAHGSRVVGQGSWSHEPRAMSREPWSINDRFIDILSTDSLLFKHHPLCCRGCHRFVFCRNWTLGPLQHT